MKTIKDLEEIGFKEIGNWFINIENTIDFSVEDENSTGLLYSFISKYEDKIDILYIGKTIKTLTDRMKGYRKPGKTQNTNIRLNAILKSKLEDEHKVYIYTLINKEDIMFKGIKINLSAGLEDNLIKMFNPKNNLHGNSKIVEDLEIDENNIIVESINSEKNNVCYTGEKIASNSNLQGIINLGFIPREYLPEYGDIVTIHLDTLIFEVNYINGNRHEQHDPRLNSRLIGNWLSERIDVNEKFYVKVCNNNTFYFYTDAQ